MCSAEKAEMFTSETSENTEMFWERWNDIAVDPVAHCRTYNRAKHGKTCANRTQTNLFDLLRCRQVSGNLKKINFKLYFT